MDLKEEPSDLYGVIKTEPNVASGQTEENDWCSGKQEPYFANVDEIKQEIVECVVPKIEYQLPDFPEKIEYNSIKFVSATTKKELDVHDVVDISEIKQEVSDSEFIQYKTERELLTTYCDLPTLKSENTESLDNFVQPCSSRYAGKTLKTITNGISDKKKQYPCLVCQKNLSSSKSRSKHINRHFGKRFTVCEFCGKFMTKIDFFRHYFVHLVHNRPIKVSLKINNVSSIHQDVIIQTKEKPFKCEICLRQFRRKSELRIHSFIHTDEKPFSCDVCSKFFIHKTSYHRHLIIHTNEKPFKCAVCSKGFNRNSSLRKHLIIHTNVKPFKCNICFKEFKLKTNLQEHLKVIHTDETPFKCDICYKEFKRPYKLQRHLLVHSDEKPFKCDFCCKEFKRKNDRKRHLLNHTDETIYKCDLCFKKLKNKSSLQRHLKQIHYSKKTFICNICAKIFKGKYYLDLHLLTHTDNQKE